MMNPDHISHEPTHTRARLKQIQKWLQETKLDGDEIYALEFVNQYLENGEFDDLSIQDTITALERQIEDLADLERMERMADDPIAVLHTALEETK